MTGETSLQYSHVLDVADQLETLKTTITALLEESVRPEYEKIGNGSQTVWEGVAANDAKAQFNTLMNTFAEFEQAIQDQYVWIRGAVANYQAADAAAMQATQG